MVVREAFRVMIAKHHDLGGSASDQRADALHAAAGGERRMRIRPDARPAADQPQQPSSDAMPSLVNRDGELR